MFICLRIALLKANLKMCHNSKICIKGEKDCFSKMKVKFFIY